ncbi:isotocin receptor-like [Mya arenaria]|uniref:isotocin receptor-like n=1 Tax=Mya arenaria TaxID=6604 RepID=UPI0022E31EBE|nr:isotocin receptor-like [Mya arenaria]XP_052772335.1 isotocin receptor-like [Mya arenaria]
MNGAYQSTVYGDKLLVLMPPLDCVTPHTECYMQVHNTSAPMENWIEMSNYVCYIAFPVILLIGLAGNFTNIFVLLKQFRTSMDTYLLGMSIASVFLIISTIVYNIQHYIGYIEILVPAQKYALISRDWFWFVTVWLLILMSLERSITVTSRKSQSLCSPTQAAIVVVLVYLIGFISALPRYWEYDVIQQGSLYHDKTFTLLRKSTNTKITEYKAIYYWYITSITIFLPTPLLLSMLFPLCYGTRQTVISRNYLFIKHNASTALILNRRLKEEIALTKLAIVMVFLYLLLVTPFLFFDLLSHFAPGLTQTGTPFFVALYNMFTLCFHSYYMWHQQIYFCCNKIYRLQFLSSCCCCC